MSNAELLQSIFDKAKAQITLPELTAMVEAIEAAQTPGCTPAQADALTAKVADQDRLIRRLVGALQGIKENDATPRYDYRGKQAIRPFDGTAPENGRWLTPREIADTWLRLDAKLAPYLKPPAEEAPTDANPG